MALRRALALAAGRGWRAGRRWGRGLAAGGSNRHTLPPGVTPGEGGYEVPALDPVTLIHKKGEDVLVRLRFRPPPPAPRALRPGLPRPPFPPRG